MDDKEIEKLIHMNQRSLLIIGYAMAFVVNTPRESIEDERKYKWLVNAVENMVYLNKPLPPMP